MANPDDRLVEEVISLRERVGALERRAPTYSTVDGPRSDLPAGRGPRLRYGLLSDGSYGVERWTLEGVRQLPAWG